LIFLCPSLYNGDSPLLSASAFALGPAHPPGYPLYVMLGKAMTFFPVGSVTFKMNLLSALAGAAAAALVYTSVKVLTEDETASVFAALLSAFSPLAWAESTKAEVYTLNAALVMSVFYLGLRFLEDSSDRRPLLLASFVLGLGMGNHHTIGFIALPLALAAALRVRDARTVLLCSASLAAGMSVYVLSYIRSAKFLDGEALFAYSDSSTLKAFLITFFRQEYHSSLGVVASPSSDPLRFLRGTHNAARYLIYGNMGVLSLFALLSPAPARKRKAGSAYAFTALAAYFVLLPAMVYAFREPDPDNLFLLDPYLLPLLYIAAVLAGCGSSYILGTLGKWAPVARRPLALGLVLLPLVFILPGALKESDLSRYYLAEDYAENVLHSLPPESAFITASDASYFPLAYKGFVERSRADVLMLYGDEESVTTQIVPAWRQGLIFPDLPPMGHFEPVATDYLVDLKVYAFEPGLLSEEARRAFGSAPYIQSYLLLPRGAGVGSSGGEDDFLRAFDLFVYERSLGERASDRYSDEMKMSEFRTLAHFAYLSEKRGHRSRSMALYEDALRLITPKGVAHYMTYLKAENRLEEAEAFLEALEAHAAKYPEARRLNEAIKNRYLE
jgi:hypothetical protein